jgi:hypothetical protein
MSEPFRYRGFGLLIESELKLPEFAAIGSVQGEPDVSIRIGAVPLARRQTTLHEELAINSVGAAFLIRNGREITVDSFPGAKPEDVRMVLLGRVMAFLLRQRGWLPLHASGVIINGVCALFLGPSGQGKSTTAAAFHRARHLVITDDIAAVRLTDSGKCLIQSALPCVRLSDDSRSALGSDQFNSEPQTGKRRYDLLGAGDGGRYPVRCAYVLEFGDSVQIEPVPALQAVTLLSRNSVVRHLHMDPEVLSHHLRDCAVVANSIPVQRLSRPRSIEALPMLVRAVEENLAQITT